MSKLEIIKVQEKHFRPFNERNIIYNNKVVGSILIFTDYKDGKYSSFYDIVYKVSVLFYPNLYLLKEKY